MKRLAQLEVIVGTLDEAVSLLDGDLNLSAANSRFYELLGLPRDRFPPGTPLADIFRFNAERGEYGPGDVETLVAERIALAKKFEPHCFERTLSDGTTIEVRGKPLPGGGFVTSYTDITLRKRHEEALQQRVEELEEARSKLERQGQDLARLAEDLKAARDEAQAANRAKSEFLAAMSHELRTPLNAILGFSEVMKDDALGRMSAAKTQAYAGNIHHSGQHLLDLINDILDLSKIESGASELHEDDVDVAKVVHSVLRVVQRHAESSGLELSLLAPETPPLIRADERKLKQILVNLLANAIKFTEPGGRIELLAECRGERGFLFQVSDTGIGIAPHDIPKALSQFGQIDSELSRKYGGTGLGLPLAKSLIELHGGSMELRSQVGAGTTVLVYLPANRVARLADGPSPRAVPRKKAG